jgi:hypothetical protein
LEQGTIDFEAESWGSDGVSEMVRKGAEDWWVMAGVGEVGDGYAVAGFSTIETMVTRGAVRGTAKRTEHIEKDILGKSMEGGFALSISCMIKDICSAKFSGF